MRSPDGMFHNCWPNGQCPHLRPVSLSRLSDDTRCSCPWQCLGMDRQRVADQLASPLTRRLLPMARIRGNNSRSTIMAKTQAAAKAMIRSRRNQLV